MNQRIPLGVVLSLALALFTTHPAQAIVADTVPGGLSTSTISFQPYGSLTTPTTISSAVDMGTALSLESVLLSFSNPGRLRSLGAGPTALGSNGQWRCQGAFAALNDSSGIMRFSFARGMNFVGGHVNHDPGPFDGTPTFEALGMAGRVLEHAPLNCSFDSPGGTRLGLSVGFSRADAEIWSASLSNGHAVTDGPVFDFAVPASEQDRTTLWLGRARPGGGAQSPLRRLTRASRLSRPQPGPV